MSASNSPTQEIQRFHLMERPPMAALLAFISGGLNAWAFMNAGLFATIQSGNMLSGAISLALSDWQRFALVVIPILSFAAGSFLAGVLVTRLLAKGKSFTVPVLCLESLLIIVAAVLWLSGVVPETNLGAHLLCILLSFAAGAQGNSFHKEDGMIYSNVAITAVIQGAGNFLSQAFTSKTRPARDENLRETAQFVLVIIAMSGGAFVGAAINSALGWTPQDFTGNPVTATGWSLFVPAGLTLVAAAMAYRVRRRKVDPDPTR